MTEADDSSANAADLVPAAPDEPPTHARRRRAPRSAKRIATEWLTVALVAVLLALGIRTFALQAFYVPTPSMVPELDVGDRILVQKLFFSPDQLRAGDIIVFRSPPAVARECETDEADLVKRVVALPGQTIWSVGNTIYVNDKKLAQPWLPKGDNLGTAIPRQTLPKNQFYVLGDNRSVSCDSRLWGTVPAKNIIGRVILVWWRNGHPAFHIE